MQKWEYRTGLLWADVNDSIEVREYMLTTASDAEPKYSPLALGYYLDRAGAEGWELVSIQPVYAGKNQDIAHGGDGVNHWSNCYFVALKRPV